MDRIIRKVLAVQSAIALGLLTAGFACAQAAGSFSDHLSNRLAAPMPAAYHARTHQLIVGTGDGEVRKIVQAQDGTPRDAGRLHQSRDNTILRLRIDAARQRLWILDIGNVHVFDLAANRLIRTIALPNWFYSGHATNCLPDLQVDRRGAAFVSDNVQPKLWRIDADSLSVHEREVTIDSQRSLDIGFSALSMSDSGVMFAAMAASGSLWRIDMDSYRATKIALSAPVHGACALETRGPVRPREFTVFVLAAERAKFDLKRIDMRPGSSEARVETIAPDSLTAVTAPARVLAGKAISEDLRFVDAACWALIFSSARGDQQPPRFQDASASKACSYGVRP